MASIPEAPAEDRSKELAELAHTTRGAFSTVEEMAAAFLRQAIIRGVYKPGERLQQDAIAGILGVSRMPVRASLRQLEHEGLVTLHAHRGATVTTLTSDEVAEIYDMRVLLECYLLRRVMPRLRDADVKRLRVLAEQLQEATDDYEWEQLRQGFYEDLYSIADAPRALEVVMRLRLNAGPHLLHRRVMDEGHTHLGILDHLERRSADGAATWLAEHLMAVSESLQEHVSA